MGTKLRFIETHGQRVWLRIYWEEGECRPGVGYHNAMRLLFDTDVVNPPVQPGGKIGDYPPERWPTHCEDCGTPVPPLPELVPCNCGCGELVESGGRQSKEVPKRQVFTKTLYATPDKSWIGMPRVGDCYYADWYGCSDREGGVCVHGWTNCSGRHVIIHVPDPGGVSRPGYEEGHWWDVNGRASNCGLPEDTLHRCWIAHGTPEAADLHVDKSPEAGETTCNAGGGSLDTGRWHGHCHNGELTP